jgi:hypothetical protein
MGENTYYDDHSDTYHSEEDKSLTIELTEGVEYNVSDFFNTFKLARYLQSDQKFMSKIDILYTHNLHNDMKDTITFNPMVLMQHDSIGLSLCDKIPSLLNADVKSIIKESDDSLPLDYGFYDDWYDFKKHTPFAQVEKIGWESLFTLIYSYLFVSSLDNPTELYNNNVLIDYRYHIYIFNNTWKLFLLIIKDKQNRHNM